MPNYIIKSNFMFEMLLVSPLFSTYVSHYYLLQIFRIQLKPFSVLVILKVFDMDGTLHGTYIAKRSLHSPFDSKSVTWIRLWMFVIMTCSGRYSFDNADRDYVLNARNIIWNFLLAIPKFVACNFLHLTKSICGNDLWSFDTKSFFHQFHFWQE